MLPAILDKQCLDYLIFRVSDSWILPICKYPIQFKSQLFNFWGIQFVDIYSRGYPIRIHWIPSYSKTGRVEGALRVPRLLKKNRYTQSVYQPPPQRHP